MQARVGSQIEALLQTVGISPSWDSYSRTRGANDVSSRLNGPEELPANKTDRAATFCFPQFLATEIEKGAVFHAG